MKYRNPLTMKAPVILSNVQNRYGLAVDKRSELIPHIQRGIDYRTTESCGISRNSCDTESAKDI